MSRPLWFDSRHLINFPSALPKGLAEEVFVKQIDEMAQFIANAKKEGFERYTIACFNPKAQVFETVIPIGASIASDREGSENRWIALKFARAADCERIAALMKHIKPDGKHGQG